MAKFTVRVVLIDAEWDDYETLHEAMAAKGFRRTIENGDGVRFQLPDAEYNMTHVDFNADTVRDLAIAAAKTTRKKHSILITEAVTRRWVNLERV